MIVVGHRGMRFVEPENTLRAVKRALELGVDAVEVDVRRTRDGHLVLMHDPTVDRTTNGRGRVRDLTLAEIRRLDAGKGERVPTLTEVLEVVRGKAKLFLEIKEPDIVGDVVREVKREGMLGEVLFISFFHPAVRKLKELVPKAEVGIIFSCEPVDPASLAKQAGASWIAANFAFTTRELVEKAHRAGLKVNVWVVNTPEDLRRARDLGVDAVTTDRADLIVPLVRSRGLDEFI